MDIKSIRILLENVVAEYPELLNELMGENQRLKLKEKMETQTVRMPLELKARITVLMERQGKKQSDIIRDALEIGVSRMEEDAG